MTIPERQPSPSERLAGHLRAAPAPDGTAARLEPFDS